MLLSLHFNQRLGDLCIRTGYLLVHVIDFGGRFGDGTLTVVPD